MAYDFISQILKDGEFSESKIGSKSEFEKVGIIATRLLKELGAYSPETAKKTTEIFEKYKQLTSEEDSDVVNVNPSTFYQSMSYLSRSEEYPIVSVGPKLGYYIETNEEPAPFPEKSSDEIDKESKLYPFFKIWLESQGYKGFNVADKRAQGKWQNPDVVGLKVVNIIGVPQVILTSIEVKLSLKNWEQQIFEAVAHTMFAHHTYYAFVCTKEELMKQFEKIKSYACRFKIGILAILVNPCSTITTDMIENEEAIIEEIIPAPYSTPSLTILSNFLEKSLNISCITDLTK